MVVIREGAAATPERQAAGVVHAALVRREHLHQQLDHELGRAELPALLALGARELGEKVLVDAAEHVLRPRCVAPDLDVAHELDQRAERLFVEPLSRA